MPNLRSNRTAALLLQGLLVAATASAQAEPTAPDGAPATAAPAAPAAMTVTPTLPPASGSTAPSSARPTPAQQAVLDQIRRLRDGDQRRFGSCSYRWDRWKLHADGTRTTSYSCEGGSIVDRTIGVNCSKLQINSYDPVRQSAGNGDNKTDNKPNGWAWGTWRLPQAGGEEQMVATLCANALPIPPAPTKAGDGAAPTTKTAPPPR